MHTLPRRARSFALSALALLLVGTGAHALPNGPRPHVVEPNEGMKNTYAQVPAAASRSAHDAAVAHGQSAKPVVDKHAAAIRAAAAKARFDLGAYEAAIRAAYSAKD